MNEFIIWNKDYKFFVSKENASINCLGQIRLHSGFEDIEKTCYTLHNFIGKTDINGKKIYSDCSIIKFAIIDTSDELIGFFKYNKLNLRYEIIVLDEFGYEIIVYFDKREIKNIEVIGTIQENKKLLEMK